MEPIEAPVKRMLRIVHVVVTKVQAVTTQKGGDDWVHLEGSRESLAMPPGHYNPGDTVKITFNNITRNGPDA